MAFLLKLWILANRLPTNTSSRSRFKTLLAEIHHRVKNHLAIVTSMMQLQVMDTEDIDLQGAGLTYDSEFFNNAIQSNLCK